MIYLFLDTNIYIHYQDFEQLDWTKILNLDKDENITIVIPPIIIDEIDNLKDRESNARRKKKAKSISSRIADYLLFDKTGKFDVISCKEPREALFQEHKLDKSKNDNSFILSAKQFKDDNESNIKIIAADNGVLYKAKSLNLSFYLMESSFLLKEEPTTEEKENTELKNELAKYKNRRSKPTILFENNSGILKLCKQDFISFDDFISKELILEKSKYPYWQVPNNIDENNLLNKLNKMFYNEKNIAEYNSEIDKYLEEYESYIRKYKAFQYVSKYLKAINLYIYNSGTSPTGNMHIIIKFPSEVDLYDNSNIREIYENPPSKPSESPLIPGQLRLPKPLNPVLHGANLGKTQHLWDLSHKIDNQITIRQEKITHGLQLPINLNNIRIDTRTCKSFSIEYTIIDETLIDPINGTLNIVIK